jgi:ubiquinone/menaquinone biosynthesis C-methylase UbiE
MKTRESGMPDQETWRDFFTPEETLRKLGLTSACTDVLDMGCGYGTFTVPAARMATGTVFAIDIEDEMVEATSRAASDAGLSNVVVKRSDFIADGSGLGDASVDYVMLFNILHAEDPHILLDEARRVLSPGGILGVMHWNHDPSTPRGPSMSIRPRPEQILGWAEEAGFRSIPPGWIDLPPYHYGFAFRQRTRPEAG